MSHVLLVMGDRVLGAQLADYLETRDIDVTWCPGPQAPAYVCRGGRGEQCPLTAVADVVVLDGWLASDAHRAGTPSWHMLRYYRQHGLPVVFLVGPDGLPAPIGDPDVRTVPREAAFEDIADAIFDLRVAKIGAPRAEELS